MNLSDDMKLFIKAQCGALAEAHKQAFLNAIVARATVHVIMAGEAGAEPEDVIPIVTRAIETANQLSLKFLEEVAENEKAQELIDNAHKRSS